MSAEPKHTPGPWMVVDEPGALLYGIHVVPDHEGLAARGYVGFVSQTNGHANAIANARLIAAAPDMLEALEAIVAEGPAEEPEYGDWGGDTEDAETWGLEAAAWKAASIARAAIAKATGAS